MNTYERSHIRDIALRNKQIGKTIDEAANDLARRYTTVKGRQFSRVMENRLTDLHDRIVNNTQDAVKNQWMLANTMNNKNIDGYMASVKVSEAMYKSFRSPNLSALNAFIDRTEKGMNLSDRVWKFTDGVKEQMEGLISKGVLEGKSAIALSKELKGFINGKPIPYEGTLIPGKNLNYQAIRVAATEMNMAFRTSDYLQNSRLPFVTGVTVHLSGAHPEEDICDEMQGTYPKGFEFVGWHPNCYSDDTEVYTNEGWKLFKDLSGKEQVLSLNPESKNLEWTMIVRQVKYEYHGDMMRFCSRSLDMMVTPDHKMVGFDKTSGKLRESSAEHFYEKMYPVKTRNVYSTNNRLYRTSEWAGTLTESIQIGQYKIPAELYCEFMGYYLSEGSTSRKYAVTISQDMKANPENYRRISACIEQMPFGVSEAPDKFNFYDKDLWEHVKPFGKSFEKSVPNSIKELPKEMIKIFLAAYCLGDGTIRKTKAWKGGKFRDERSFSTSSKIMADDLGELLLKIGHHPSFYVEQKGRITKHWNGEYESNHDQNIVRDCRSQYAVQFNREKVSYSGYVYDIEVEKNHIIYVRRNGKCVWGSNCICFATYDTLDQDEFVNYIKSGEIDQARMTTGIPQGAQQFLDKHGEQLLSYKNQPYWLKDNFNKNLALQETVNVKYLPEKIDMVQGAPVEIEMQPVNPYLSESPHYGSTNEFIENYQEFRTDKGFLVTNYPMTEMKDTMLIDMIEVEEKYRRTGEGSRILLKSLKDMSENGIKMVEAATTEQGGYLFKTFENKGILERIWSDDLLASKQITKEIWEQMQGGIKVYRINKTKLNEQWKIFKRTIKG